MIKLPKFQKGHHLRAKEINRHFRETERLDRLIPGFGLEMTRTAAGTTLSVNRGVVAAAGIQAKAGRIKSIHGDYFVAEELVSLAEFKVAKPELLRLNPWDRLNTQSRERVIDDTRINYLYTDRTEGQKRDAWGYSVSSGDLVDREAQVVTPRYLVGDLVLAIYVDSTDVAQAPRWWELSPVRSWARVSSV